MRKRFNVLVLFFTFSLVLTSLNSISAMVEIEIDSLIFHESVEKDAVFNWEIKKFTFEGEIFGTTTFPMPYQEGDILTIRVIKDPSEANLSASDLGIFEYQINGTPVTTDFFVEPGFSLLGITYFGFFISSLLPLQFTNSSGTYDFFEFYYEMLLWQKEIIESQLENATMTVELDSKYLTNTQDFVMDGDDYSIESHNTIKWNRKTGFLEKSEGNTEINFNGSLITSEVLIELQSSISIPFNWCYSLFSVLIISLFVLVLRKKKLV